MSTSKFSNLAYVVPVMDSFVLPASRVIGAVTVPLACLFLYFLYFYQRAFAKNLPAHAASSFMPLTSYTWHTIVYNYCSFVASAILFIGINMYYEFSSAKYVSALFIVLTFVIICSTSSYQWIISIISIQRFWNKSQLEANRVKWTQNSVRTLMIVVAVPIVVKELVVWCRLLYVLLDPEPVEEFFYPRIYFVFFVHAGIYLLQQIILIIAMICELSTSAPATGHSEYLLSNHTKYIGIVKTAFFLTFIWSWNADYYPFVIYFALIGVDLFLVPLIVEVTEVNSKPNIVMPNGNTIMHPLGAWS